MKLREIEEDNEGEREREKKTISNETNLKQFNKYWENLNLAEKKTGTGAENKIEQCSLIELHEMRMRMRMRESERAREPKTNNPIFFYAFCICCRRARSRLDLIRNTHSHTHIQKKEVVTSKIQFRSIVIRFGFILAKWIWTSATATAIDLFVYVIGNKHGQIEITHNQ